jgi:hypothetical protein
MRGPFSTNISGISFLLEVIMASVKDTLTIADRIIITNANELMLVEISAKYRSQDNEFTI